MFIILFKFKMIVITITAIVHRETRASLLSLICKIVSQMNVFDVTFDVGPV